jgi:hypothetical protein
VIEVTFHSERKLVRAVMGGLLTVADVERFSREEQEGVRAMGLASGEFLLLVETRGSVVQSQAVVAAFQNLMLHSALKAKRIATVRAGALTTLQTRRIASVNSSARVFETSEEAQAWLFS